MIFEIVGMAPVRCEIEADNDTEAIQIARKMDVSTFEVEEITDLEIVDWWE